MTNGMSAVTRVKRGNVPISRAPLPEQFEKGDEGFEYRRIRRVIFSPPPPQSLVWFFFSDL